MFSRKVQARCLFSLFAGLLSSLGFAPVSFWPVTIMGIMALMAAADGVRCRPEIFCVGWAFGFGQSALSLHWLAQAFQYQTSLPSWTGGAAVLVLAGYLALYPALALTFAKWVARDGATFRMLAFPAAWVLAEWSRGWLFTGFAWNPLGVIWIDVPIIAEIAGWVGATGLSGLTVALAGSFLQFVRRHRFFLGLQTAVLVFAAIAPRPALGTKSGGIRVRIVQPNIGQDEKWQTDLSRRHRQTLLTLSGRPRGDGRVRLIFWPEAAITEEIERAPAHPKGISRHARSAGSAADGRDCDRAGGRRWSAHCPQQHVCH